MVASRCGTYYSGYGDLSLGDTEVEIRSFRIFGVTLNYKLTLETHLREVVSKAARSFGAVCRVGKFQCKSCFNAYVLLIMMT